MDLDIGEGQVTWCRNSSWPWSFLETQKSTCLISSKWNLIKVQTLIAEYKSRTKRPKHSWVSNPCAQHSQSADTSLHLFAPDEGDWDKDVRFVTKGGMPFLWGRVCSMTHLMPRYNSALRMWYAKNCTWSSPQISWGEAWTKGENSQVQKLLATSRFPRCKSCTSLYILYQKSGIIWVQQGAQWRVGIDDGMEVGITQLRHQIDLVKNSAWRRQHLPWLETAGATRWSS